MAATYRTSAAGGGTSGTTNRTVTITPAVGDYLVLFATISGSTNWSPSVTDSNASAAGWSLVGVCRWNSSADLMACWVRKALMANTTSTVITCNSGSNTAAELVVLAYSGMTRVGINGIRQWAGQENQASGGTPTPVLNASALTGNPTLWAVASGDTTTSPNASWTERQDVSQSTPTTALEVATRDSGFTGTSVAAAATQSTVFASMIVELDSSASGLGIAQSTGTQRLISTPNSGTQTTSAIDTATVDSSYLVGLARGNWATASPSGPSDNKGNTYTIIDTDHGYTGFPDSRQALYRSEFAAGGSGHTFSANFGSFDVPATTGDEITLFAMELTGNAVFEASSHVSRTGAASLTTGNVTTAGGAMLIAVLWGTNGVGVTHQFHGTPSQGWSKLLDCSFEGDPGGGYIQVCVFVKQVFAAGTYSGTFFTTNTEGAEIDLVAMKIGANNRTLAASAGSVTITGTAASLKVAHKIPAAPGSVAITGTAANLEFGRKMGATAGSVAISGTAASLRVARNPLVASAGAATVTGSSAALKRALLVGASSGAIAIAGTAAALLVDRLPLAASSSAVGVTGTAATLRADRKLTAAIGSAALTGTAVALRVSRVLAASSGSVASTGTAAILKRGLRVAAIPGTAAITGTDAALRYSGGGSILDASPGAVGVSGAAAGLLWQRRIAADEGAAVVAGTAAALLRSRRLAVATGAVAITGSAATLAVDTGPSGPVYAAIFIPNAMTATWVSDHFATIFMEADVSDEKRIRQSETPKTITARAFTATAFPDLTTYTQLKFRMVGPTTIEGDATGDVNGYLSYTFTGTELDALGTYEAKFTGVDPDGEPKTFPESTNLRVVIIPAL
jgi:hypothetical protein